MINKKNFLISWKKFGYIILAWIISVLLHNFISALFGFEEALFFIIAVFIIPLYTIIIIIYSLVMWMKGG